METEGIVDGDSLLSCHVLIMNGALRDFDVWGLTGQAYRHVASHVVSVVAEHKADVCVFVVV